MDIWGNIYRFDLIKNRTGSNLFGPLADRIANDPEEVQSVKFGEGLDAVTDIDVGPDGRLYVVSL